MVAEDRHVGDADRTRRVRLQIAIEGRLERVRGSGNPAAVLESGAQEDARMLAGMVRDDEDDVRSRLLLGWLHWHRYVALPIGLDEAELRTAVEMLTPCFIADVWPLPEPLLAVLADHVGALLADRHQQILVSTDLGLFADSIALWRRVLAVTPADSPNRGGFLSNWTVPGSVDTGLKVAR